MKTAARTPHRHTGLVLASATALLALTAATWPLHSQAQTASTPTAQPTAAAPGAMPPPTGRPGDGPARPMHAKHHGPGGPGAGGPGGLPGGHQLQMLLEHAKATPEQRTQIEAVMQQARQDLRAQRDSGRATHQQLMQALAQPTVDARAIEKLRQQALAQHDKASQRMTQALVDSAKLLTPEQRASLSQHLASLDRPDRAEHTRGERPPRGLPPPPGAAPGAAPGTTPATR